MVYVWSKMLLLSSMCLCLSWLLVLLGVLYWYKWFRLWEWGHLCSLKNSIFLVDWRGLVCWLLCVSLYLCWFDEHLCGYIVFCSTDCYAFSLVVHAKWYLPHLLVWNTYMCVNIFFFIFFSWWWSIFNFILHWCVQHRFGTMSSRYEWWIFLFPGYKSTCFYFNLLFLLLYSSGGLPDFGCLYHSLD